jgi:signal transduction histidine kinase
MLAEDEAGREGTDLKKIRDAGHLMLALIEENFTTDADAARAPSAAAVAKQPSPAPTYIAQKPDIAPGLLLVVDDDASNRDVLSRRLTRQGHTVVTANSGPEALQVVRGGDFDLVLLDIMMPDMDGYEVLGQMKADARLRHIPVIMISALNEVQSVVRCVEAGAEDYLAKPFDATLLKARIGACLEAKRGRDRETVLFEQLQNNYEHLQELETLRDDMRNMIVHDLRTPLTAVIAGVEMLEKYGALNPTQQEMMTIAAGGGRTLLRMINDLLDVEKMESGSSLLQYEELSPATLVASALLQVTSLAEEAGTTLVTEIAGGMRRFSGDENKLTRTLVNLIANAIKFTHAGTVTIAASPHDGKSIRFAVRDTGQGIPADAFERIFEKFGQVDSRNKVGTGLGLAFCKLAVEAHGGLIAVESTPGAGSTFSFTIPLVAK